MISRNLEKIGLGAGYCGFVLRPECVGTKEPPDGHGRPGLGQDLAAQRVDVAGALVPLDDPDPIPDGRRMVQDLRVVGRDDDWKPFTG